MSFDQLAQWFCGAAILLTLGMIFAGLGQGLARPAGRTSGRATGWLRSPLFYVLASLAYFGLGWLLWRPLLLKLEPASRTALLFSGALLLLLGLSLVWWGRLALGKNYFASTGLGAQLFSGQALVTHGPYACLRHPMYLGYMLVGLGGLLVYWNWTFLLVALGFVGLVRRARREEAVLAAEFGPLWEAYCQRVPAFLPFTRSPRLFPAWHPSLSALFELGLLFLPAIPAYLWVWPRLSEQGNSLFQVLTYLYVLAGTLLIGLRRWSWADLGLNRKGLGLAAVCGAAILLGRLLILRSIDWGGEPAPLTWAGVLGNLLFYFGLVGLVEELLFRGLVYRLLEDWRGAAWAIWGSSLGFGLWHVFGQGVLAGLATAAVGVLFALIRWRAGGIVGLIALHGLWDLEVVWLVSTSNAEILAPGAVRFTSLAGICVGVVFLFLVPAAILLGPWLIKGRRWQLRD